MLTLVDFSERLRAERKRLDLTQAEVAEKIGVSRATTLAYDTGRVAPDVLVLDRLQDVGMRTDFLLSGRARPLGKPDVDWDLALKVLSGIQQYAQDIGIRLDARKVSQLLELLYPVALERQHLYRRTLESAVRLAAA